MTIRLSIFGRRLFTMLGACLLLLAAAPLGIHAMAQSNPDPARVNFEDVCPDMHLFPSSTSPGLRNSYAYSWQRDYPAIVFNAKDGRSYWLDYNHTTDPRTIVPLDSVFSPITYSAEKVLVFVCGLHFNAKASAVPTTQTIPDGGPQIDLTAAATTPLQVTPPPSTGAPGGTVGFTASVYPKQPPAPPVNPCPAIENDATTAQASYVDARNEMQRVLDTSGLFDDSPFSFGELESAIQDATPSPGAEDAYNVSAFQTSLSTIQNLGTRLSTSISAWNTFVNRADFMAAWTRLNGVITGARDLQKQYTDNKCPQSGIISSIANDTSSDFKTEFDNASGHLRGARTNLLAAYQTLDDWYGRSSVSTVLILPPVGANSLTQVAVQVTDPWVPLATTPMSVASVKPVPVKQTKKTETVITIDRTDTKKSTITVTGGGTGSVTTTATDDSGKPVVSVQVTQSGGATSSSAAPAGSSGTNATSSPSAGAAASANATTGSQTSPSAPNPKQGSTAPVVATSSVPNAAYLVARHRWVNFVPSAGLLVTRFTEPNYNVETLPLTTNTTTTTTSSTCTPSSTPPCSPTVTITSISSTANFAFNSPSGSFQQTAIAGITWYPFGRDTYSVTNISRSGRPTIDTYAAHSVLSRFGVFGGTSIASLGTFVISPTFEVKPGIELFSGLTLTNKTSLTAGVIPCGSAGSSTINEPPVTSTSSPPGGGTTTTTVNVQLITGCATANATILGGTTVPTQTTLVPAFSFGFLLNANLFQYLNL